MKYRTGYVQHVQEITLGRWCHVLRVDDKWEITPSACWRCFGLLRTVEQGCTIPKWYGVAYRDWVRNLVWTAPIPLNIAIRAAHIAWVWCKYPWRKAVDRNGKRI